MINCVHYRRTYSFNKGLFTDHAEQMCETAGVVSTPKNDLDEPGIGELDDGNQQNIQQAKGLTPFRTSDWL